MSTPNEAWRRRRTARLYDTEPRMHAGLVGELPELGNAPDHACRGCGFHVCGCESGLDTRAGRQRLVMDAIEDGIVANPGDAIRSMGQPHAPAYARVDLANGRVRWDCSVCGDVLCRGREADAQRMAAGHVCLTVGTVVRSQRDGVGVITCVGDGFTVVSYDTYSTPVPQGDIRGAIRVLADDEKAGRLVLAIHTARPERPSDFLHDAVVTGEVFDHEFELRDATAVTHWSVHELSTGRFEVTQLNFRAQGPELYLKIRSYLR